MRKIIVIIGLFSLSFIGCDKGCKDSTACNYGMSEECKFSLNEDALLKGSWNLVEIYNVNDVCIFSVPLDMPTVLGSDVIYGINLTFNDNKTCEVLTTPSDYSEQLSNSDWLINVCTNFLHFDSPILSDDVPSFPFGSQKIIELSSTKLLVEDLDGNTLHWEKI
ncbi:MAG: hypothetical protein CMP50_04140 [Flavobacteriales bacterium]|nr:hypothetical protein [Flavobacteriales bacterium]|tara:strand:+ start:1651 stop:2142 length:492 start_codon:yes stop_codon:yes gene_type:complete